MHNLLRRLFLTKCVFCSYPEKVICNRCISECRLIYDTNCLVCQKPSCTGQTHISCTTTTPVAYVLSLYLYKDLVKATLDQAEKQESAIRVLSELTKRGLRHAQAQGLRIEPNTIAIPHLTKPEIDKPYRNAAIMTVTNLLAQMYNIQFLQWGTKTALTVCNRNVLLVDLVLTEAKAFATATNTIKNARPQTLGLITLAKGIM